MAHLLAVAANEGTKIVGNQILLSFDLLWCGLILLHSVKVAHYVHHLPKTPKFLEEMKQALATSWHFQNNFGIAEAEMMWYPNVNCKICNTVTSTNGKHCDTFKTHIFISVWVFTDFNPFTQAYGGQYLGLYMVYIHGVGGCESRGQAKCDTWTVNEVLKVSITLWTQGIFVVLITYTSREQVIS